MKSLLPLAAALGIMASSNAMASDVAVRAVSHQVTPKNIEKQPFSFKVTVKSVKDEKAGHAKDFEIRVGPKKTLGGSTPGAGENGSLEISSRGNRIVETPPLTIVKSNDTLVYTLRIFDRDLDRSIAVFTYAILNPGDYYQFNLDDFLPQETTTPIKPKPELRKPELPKPEFSASKQLARLPGVN
jgi:hypothetical protein